MSHKQVILQFLLIVGLVCFVLWLVDRESKSNSSWNSRSLSSPSWNSWNSWNSSLRHGRHTWSDNAKASEFASWFQVTPTPFPRPSASHLFQPRQYAFVYQPIVLSPFLFNRKDKDIDENNQPTDDDDDDSTPNQFQYPSTPKEKQKAEAPLEGRRKVESRPNQNNGDSKWTAFFRGRDASNNNNNNNNKFQKSEQETLDIPQPSTSAPSWMRWD